MKQVTAAIIRKDKKILICQRDKDDECAMQWEFPGGKLEDNETLEECIVREIKEELDVYIKVAGIFTTSTYHYNGIDVFFTVYNSEIIDGDIKLNVHNDAKWITVNELRNYRFMSADVVFVEKLINEEAG